MAEYIDKEVAIQICMKAWDTGEASQDIKYEPSADVIPIPENATNGDMIKVMFPNAYDISNGKGGVSVYNFGGTKIPYGFNENWWNAPYRKE